MTNFPSHSIQRTRAFLAKTFPLAFAPKGAPKRPLKIGICSDIVARLEGCNKYIIFAALRDYCNGPSYLAACNVGAPRIDLDGNPCGFVTIEDTAYASTKLAEYPQAVREKWGAQQCA